MPIEVWAEEDSNLRPPLRGAQPGAPGLILQGALHPLSYLPLSSFVARQLAPLQFTPPGPSRLCLAVSPLESNQPCHLSRRALPRELQGTPDYRVFRPVHGRYFTAYPGVSQDSENLWQDSFICHASATRSYRAATPVLSSLTLRAGLDRADHGIRTRPWFRSPLKGVGPCAPYTYPLYGLMTSHTRTGIAFTGTRPVHHASEARTWSCYAQGGIVRPQPRRPHTAEAGNVTPAVFVNRPCGRLEHFDRLAKWRGWDSNPRPNGDHPFSLPSELPLLAEHTAVRRLVALRALLVLPYTIAGVTANPLSRPRNRNSGVYMVRTGRSRNAR